MLKQPVHKHLPLKSYLPLLRVMYCVCSHLHITLGTGYACVHKFFRKRHGGTCRKKVGWLWSESFLVIVNLTVIKAFIFLQNSPVGHKQQMFLFVILVQVWHTQLFLNENSLKLQFSLYKNKIVLNNLIKGSVYLLGRAFQSNKIKPMYWWIWKWRSHSKTSSCPSSCTSHRDALGNIWSSLNQCTLGVGKPWTTQCRAVSVSTATVIFSGPCMISRLVLRPISKQKKKPNNKKVWQHA